MEQGFNSCRIAVDEEFVIKPRESVMDRQGFLEIAVETEPHHFAEFRREGVADYRNHSDGAERNQRIGKSVIARHNLKHLRLVVDDFLDLLEIARSLLDADDILKFVSKPESGRRFDIDARSSRHIIKHYRKLGIERNFAKMLINSLLRRFVIIGRSRQYGRKTGKIG